MGVTSRPVYQCWLDIGTLVILLLRNKSQVPSRGGDHMKAGARGQRDHGDALVSVSVSTNLYLTEFLRVLSQRVNRSISRSAGYFIRTQKMS